MPGVLDEIDAPQELQIAPQNLHVPMVQAEEGPTEVEAPVNLRRRPHTRPQRLGQNIYGT